MLTRNMHEDDPLEDFDHREITLEDVTKLVHVAGAGPAVIVMTEMPGISPHVARFSRWVRDAGFTVYMPSLFGRDGAVANVEEGVAVFQRACVSAEFRAFAANKSSPVTQWLRSLARLAHARRLLLHHMIHTLTRLVPWSASAAFASATPFSALTYLAASACGLAVDCWAKSRSASGSKPCSLAIIARVRRLGRNGR